jgi:uncharacterized protein
MRLALDTNVVVSAALGSSAPTRLIELATEGEITLATSAALLAELADVLAREHIGRRLPLRNRAPAELLAFYESLADVVDPASIARSAPDPDDDHVLACALGAHADLVVSGDKRLRNLKRYQNMPILSPAEALALVARRSSNS